MLTSFQGMIAMPNRAVTRAPVLKDTALGATLTKALAGATTLAAMLVVSVAHIRPVGGKRTQQGDVSGKSKAIRRPAYMRAGCGGCDASGWHGGTVQYSQGGSPTAISHFGLQDMRDTLSTANGIWSKTMLCTISTGEAAASSEPMTTHRTERCRWAPRPASCR